MSSPLLPLLQRLPKPIKARLRAARRRTGSSPIQQVFDELERRGTPVREARVLEVFGGNGDLHVMDYAPRVAALEVWELDPSCEPQLRANISTARIKIGDSFQLIKHTRSRYDIIVVDNPLNLSATPVELYVAALQKVRGEPVFILTVIPDISPATRRIWPALRQLQDVEALLQRRREWFQTDVPEYVSREQMSRAYAELARPLGFVLEWWFTQRRHFGEYLVFKLRSSASKGSRSK